MKISLLSIVPAEFSSSPSIFGNVMGYYYNQPEIVTMVTTNIILLYSVLFSSISPFDSPLLPGNDLVSGAGRTSLEGVGDGFMRVRDVSSLSNSSLPSSE